MLNIKPRNLLATHIVACEQAFCLGKGYSMKNTSPRDHFTKQRACSQAASIAP